MGCRDLGAEIVALGEVYLLLRDVQLQRWCHKPADLGQGFHCAQEPFLQAVESLFFSITRGPAVLEL